MNKAEFTLLIKQYSDELEEVLESCDYNKYCNFVRKWANEKFIDDKTYSKFVESDEQTRLNSYCVLILGSRKTSEKAKEWARNNKVDAKC